jgi:hypothetical protein
MIWPMTEATLSKIPPVVAIPVEFALDRLIARDTARRVTATLGFSLAGSAGIGSAVAHLCELLLKTNTAHELHFNGITDGSRVGVEVSCKAPWIAHDLSEPVSQALVSRLSDLIDRITVAVEDKNGEASPCIVLIAWCR